MVLYVLIVIVSVFCVALSLKARSKGAVRILRIGGTLNAVCFGLASYAAMDCATFTDLAFRGCRTLPDWATLPVSAISLIGLVALVPVTLPTGVLAVFLEMKQRSVWS